MFVITGVSCFAQTPPMPKAPLNQQSRGPNSPNIVVQGGSAVVTYGIDPQKHFDVLIQYRRAIAERDAKGEDLRLAQDQLYSQRNLSAKQIEELKESVAQKERDFRAKEALAESWAQKYEDAVEALRRSERERKSVNESARALSFSATAAGTSMA